MSIASRITQFRESLGIKKSELAKMLGVSAPTITYFETGKRQPSLKTVMQLSDIFKVPLEYILTDKEYAFQVACRSKGVRNKAKLMEIAEFSRIVDSFLHLSNLVGFSYHSNVPNTYKGRILQDSDLAFIKESLSLPSIVDYQSLYEALWEKWGIIVFSIPFKERGLSGMTIKNGDNYFVFTNSGYGRDRELFSLAHELGHIVMHMNDDDTSIEFSSRSQQEKQANTFAQAFLIPTDILQKQLEQRGLQISPQNIRCLAENFNVSYECMVYNLNKLGLINYTHPYAKSTNPKIQDYPDDWDYNNLPSIYYLLVYKAWSSGYVSISKAAKYLYVDNVTAMTFFRSISGFIPASEGVGNETDS
jgi:Zn-dependent peptidase ImmA (M78 family)/DNA-binding XRE family transcriptional regulator